MRDKAGPEAGFSLIEGLIGAGILLIVMIGLIPLFTRAITDNTAGSDYTREAQYAKSRIEDFAKTPLGVGPYVIAPGTTQTVIDEYLDPTTQTWQPIVGSPPAKAEWRRTSTVTGYAISVPFTIGTPVDGSVAPAFEQIVVVVKNLEGGTGIGPLLQRKSTTVAFLKSF
jgi:hypothetical protein